MKRVISVGLVFGLMMTLTACSGYSDGPEFLDKEGIAPYELSKSNEYVLQSYGLNDISQIISYHAPKEALSLNVNVYRLEAGGKWGDIGGGSVSIGIDRKPSDQLTGTLTMQLKDNYAVDFHINGNGVFFWTTDEILIDSEAMVSSVGFLQDFQEIEINKEIPVALMVYDSGMNMQSYSLQDYFEPTKFEGMDLVQMVTVEFSDK